MGIIAIHCGSNMEHKGTSCRQGADTDVTKGSFTQTTTAFYRVNANTNRRCNKENLGNTRIFTVQQDSSQCTVLYVYPNIRAFSQRNKTAGNVMYCTYILTFGLFQSATR
jgi:hypothetical protein